MSAVEALDLDFAGAGANAQDWLGEGWHGPEPTHRWMDGAQSVVRLPPLRAQKWFVLTLRGFALDLDGPAPSLRVALNGAALGRLHLTAGTPHAAALPGELMRADAENQLVFHHPDAARPSDRRPGHKDTRWLSSALESLALAPLDAPLHQVPRLLPPPARLPQGEAARALVENFQSLGQNCGLGGVQRHYGAEPFGLLRFASVHPGPLVEGLSTRFQGVGDLDRLAFRPSPQSGELKGHHAAYGLDYHTFRRPEDTDVEAFARSEARRLAYLSRLFFEQLENDEKIFVRVGGFAAPGEGLALHRLLCAYNPSARLLILDRPPPEARERAGRVIEARPGLYRGYFQTLTDPVHGPRPPPEEWLRLCATLSAPPSRAPRSAA